MGNCSESTVQWEHEYAKAPGHTENDEFRSSEENGGESR